MGHCYSKKTTSVTDNDAVEEPTPESIQTTPFQSPLPAGIYPSPARTPGRKIMKWPFPPPSPAKPIMAALRRRRRESGGVTPERAVEQDGERARERELERERERGLDKNFGYSKNFGAKYELGKEVGRGHFGHTCWAKGKKGDVKGVSVAVKIISKAKMISVAGIEDVRREVKMLKALSSGNPHMLKFYDAFEDADNVYLVMELCEGGELLERILQRGGRLAEDDAKGIVVQILTAVAFCHLQGVVHRDLKLETFYGETESAVYRAVLRADPNFDDIPWPNISAEAKNFVKRLLKKNYRKRMTAAQALAHPWLRDENRPLPLDIFPFKLVRSFMFATPLKRAALKALSKALTENELFYLKAQFRLLEPKDGCVSLGNFKAIEPFSSRKIDFEEFCAAAISVYQLEALEDWNKIATTAFQNFEQEGKRRISVEDFTRELNLGPTAQILVKDWIRSSDGNINFIGYTKFLQGVRIRGSNTRRQ